MNLTKLSVNINKLATLRNARGGDVPNLVEFSKNIEKWGAQGITVHPRPDERHIRYQDVYDLKPVVVNEFNIEGNPIPKFIEMVCKVIPEQVTLVPDSIDAITSNAGWNPIENMVFLKEVIAEFKAKGIRTSIFLDPNPEWVEAAAKTGADRIELYTEAFANSYAQGDLKGIEIYKTTAQRAQECGLDVNAGHDLSLENIAFFAKEIPWVKEVSIGHALISEALVLGLENTIQSYRYKIERAQT